MIMFCQTIEPENCLFPFTKRTFADFYDVSSIYTLLLITGAWAASQC